MDSQRYGVNSPQNLSNLQSGLIDNLSMTYIPGTNKLQNVIDNGQADFKHLGFAQAAGTGSTANVYDASDDRPIPIYNWESSERFHSIGRSLRPTGSQHGERLFRLSIAYNHLNLPSAITFANGNKIENLYTASGTKLKTIRSTNTTVIETQHYVGGIEYKQQPNTTNYPRCLKNVKSEETMQIHQIRNQARSRWFKFVT